METNIILAKLLGIYLIVSGLFVLLKGKTFPIMLKDFFAHRATMYLAGVFLLFLGGFIVVRHYVGEVATPTIVVVMGWLIFLKGLLYIFASEKLVKIAVSQFRGLTGLLGVLVAALGVWLLTLNFKVFSCRK